MGADSGLYGGFGISAEARCPARALSACTTLSWEAGPPHGALATTGLLEALPGNMGILSDCHAHAVSLSPAMPFSSSCLHEIIARRTCTWAREQHGSRSGQGPD